MLSLKRILLPVDFSPRSIAAAHYAKALARSFQVEVILFHAVPPIEYTYGFEFGGEPMEVFSRRPEEPANNWRPSRPSRGERSPSGAWWWKAILQQRSSNARKRKTSI